MTENDRKIALMMSVCPHEHLLTFCIKYMPQVEDNAVYSKMVATAWKAGGNSKMQKYWEPFFNSPRMIAKHAMTSGERRALKKLPQTILVYRALHGNEQDTAMSWTTNRVFAEKYANSLNRNIETKCISKNDIFAYFTRRNESEVILKVWEKNK